MKCVEKVIDPIPKIREGRVYNTEYNHDPVWNSKSNAKTLKQVLKRLQLTYVATDFRPW